MGFDTDSGDNWKAFWREMGDQHIVFIRIKIVAICGPLLFVARRFFWYMRDR